jgi:thiamine biosynthesis lipoprotein
MKLLICLLTTMLLISTGSARANTKPKPKKTNQLYISHFENVLGTSMELKIYASSPNEAAGAEAAVLREISRMAKILSGYDPNSEFSRWLKTSGQPVKVSPELLEVLELFDDWRGRSSGALDASAEVITKLWKQAATKKKLPTQEELAAAVQEVQRPHWKLNKIEQTATHLDDAPLMLNSFAKSYIIKHASDAAMLSSKLSAIVVNIGGDLLVSGNLDETIEISNPKADAENEEPVDQLLINNKAVATSGNYRRGELIDGHWYSHIVDPRTGVPADDILSATVIAPNATDAGALATAFNVMKPSESIKLASTIPGAEYLIITKSGQRIVSQGWNYLETPLVRQTKNREPGGLDDFELVINLEINLQKEGFVKRPYVAVWVEDENHAAVRTISVWHGSDRYMPELKSWFLKYRGRYNTDRSFTSSITSATRPAGKYTLKWDGKDDEGNLLKPGKYVIKIEASREHGTYQLMRQEIDCDETPKMINLTGNIEVASASLDYRKKTNSN